MSAGAKAGPGDGRAGLRKRACGGFTQVDLLAVLSMGALIYALVIASVTASRNKERLSVCISNLRQVNQGVLQYGADHGERLPGLEAGEQRDLWWWYKEKVKGYVGLTGPSSADDSVFACPMDRGYSDPEPFCKTARFDYGSYVFNGVHLLGAPNIAGWKVSSIREPARTLLMMEWTAHAPLSWHRSRTGRANLPFYNNAESVVGFVDGHVSLAPIYYDGYNAAYTRDPVAGYGYKYSGR